MIAKIQQRCCNTGTDAHHKDHQNAAADTFAALTFWQNGTYAFFQHRDQLSDGLYRMIQPVRIAKNQIQDKTKDDRKKDLIDMSQRADQEYGCRAVCSADHTKLCTYYIKHSLPPVNLLLYSARFFTAQPKGRMLLYLSTDCMSCQSRRNPPSLSGTQVTVRSSPFLICQSK